MPATYTDLLGLTLQATGEHDNTWGETLNTGVFQLVEDALAGMVSISLASGDQTLTIPDGADTALSARHMMMNLTGTLSANRVVNVPARTKLYLVINGTTGSYTVTVKVTGQTGIEVPQGSAKLLYCNGTDVEEVTAAAVSATLAATATNALSLGGVLAANYARLDIANLFNGKQAVTKVALTDTAGVIAVDAALSNSFGLTMDGNHTLANPTNGTDGQVIRIVIKQDATGSRVITWGSKYAFVGGVSPVLSTAANAIDYASFEYDSAADKWLGGLGKGFD
jgi:hypothetical protein